MRARRGIVLVLVLAMLGLLALIGVTFATFSGQAKINARNFAQSVIGMQDDELMDFALSQLINDTGDVRSAIRGHSLARDMYGSNITHANGYLTSNPATGGPLLVSNFKQALPIPGDPYSGTYYDILTNIPIPSNNPALYGFDFTRWIVRISFAGPAFPRPVDQTFEILFDDYAPNSNATQFSGQGFHVFRVIPSDVLGSSTTTAAGTTVIVNALNTALNNPTAAMQNGLGAWQNLLMQPGPNVAFILDGRWLHAFNGPGMGANAIWGNFRYNGGLLQTTPNPALATFGQPGAMDEDYDACDLENWFLAIQSADGQVMIPSFHRPAVIRIDNANGVNDWLRVNKDGPNGTYSFASAASRILRPVRADRHDAATFPDLTPDPNTGRIPYDVDNDGDGVTDSVWVDLGYPARRDSRGQLFKPLFAFMVIGLNGRIPLNTAGNLAGAARALANGAISDGAGADHDAHLGNSVSEVDLTYALQNGFFFTNLAAGVPKDATGAFTPQPFGGFAPGNIYTANNTQVDNGGIDVRLTQLRNLLAGTRPQKNPFGVDTTTNGDANFVLFSPTSALQGQTPYFMPNGVADAGLDANGNAIDTIFGTDANTAIPYVVRTTLPVPGRWGEPQSIPGIPFPNPNPNAATATPVQSAILGVVEPFYSNPVRAGYSFDVSDYSVAQTTYGDIGFPRDAADDNYNSFDPFPLGHTGEVGDADFYDAAGGLMLPIDRMRRYLTPADINGTGRVTQWNPTNRTIDRGGDQFGRVEFSSYFRPPGSPGAINFSTTNPSTYGAIGYGSWNPAGQFTAWTAGTAYVPDLTNNLLHGFEAFRFPNQTYTPPGFTPQQLGGSPADLNIPANAVVPTAYPTYDTIVNSRVRSDGLNEADEMNLYVLNPLLDSPYGPSDLEWLYRQQDIDGASLTSRLSQLAPISFKNAVDGQRRRRLVALDSWESNNFVWANDNPQGTFPNNSRFLSTANAGFSTLNVNGSANLNVVAVTNKTFPAPSPTWSLAHREKKINLNYPLPVSNDPNEPIRQKWISDTYQLLKAILPPQAVDTPEELAQLSQFVINIIDFRDPDTTMTHWQNPDVVLSGVATAAGGGGGAAVPPTPPSLIYAPANTLPPSPLPAGQAWLDQYGMEYNPVALNEVLAYSFQYVAAAGGTPTQAKRFFVELVNTLTSPETGTASVLDLGGSSATPTDPYSGGCWDIVLTGDDPYSRPDPYRGDLSPYGNYYGLIPLNGNSFSSSYPGVGGGVPTTIPGVDVTLQPLLPDQTGANNTSVPKPVAGGAATLPTNYFYVFGNTPPSVTPAGGATTPYENSPLQPGWYYGNGGATPNQGNGFTGTTGYMVPANTPAVLQTLNAATGFDPFTGAAAPTGLQLYPGVLPGITAATTSQNLVLPNYMWKVPYPTTTGAPVTPLYYWVCLRRPANPSAPVGMPNSLGQYNPMVVVDAVRVPMVDGTGSIVMNDPNGNPGAVGTFNTIYSVQRLQPYRGGHAVPPPPGGALATPPKLDARYGYTEQIGSPTANSVSGFQTQGIYFINTTGTLKYASTYPIYHTLGWANEGEMGSGMGTSESWDYLPFHDRDFTSVAELMLVPGCPPGLFTKQFTEFAPSQKNATSIFSLVAPLASPTFTNTSGWAAPMPVPTTNTLGTVPGAYSNATTALSIDPSGGGGGPGIIQPHSFPYLSDKFFYSGYGATGTLDTGSLVGGYAADGWFKMFEFFEVPSQMIGSTGPVTQGVNFDWARQDSKPGLLNLNLIIDEEVFFSVAGAQIIAQQNGQGTGIAAGGGGTLTPQTPFDQFNQQLLNFDQIPALTAGNYTVGGATLALPLPAGSSPVPMVVTSILANGAPASAYPIASPGYLAADPVFNFLNGSTPAPGVTEAVAPVYSNAIKAAWAQFLSLRHGGSGYIFGFGNGAVGQNVAVTGANGTPGGTGIPAERPFHALSYPDIDYTVMRPAALPPSTYTTPALNVTVTPTTLGTTYPTTYYTNDPGVRNPLLYWGYPTSFAPGFGYNTVGGTVTPVVLPPPIPARRLFQPPDAYNPNPATPPGTGVAAASNASEAGDPYLNNLTLIPNPPTGIAAGTPPTPAPGALTPILSTTYLSTAPAANVVTTNSAVNLYWPGANAATSYDAAGATTTIALPAGVKNPYLGANLGGATPDAKQHPYWRSEQLQRFMNLTTVRTHQYAVWITVGFFEVKRQGDIGMLTSGNPQLAFDILGAEIGAVTGQMTRFRGFFLVDRLKLPGFDPRNTGSFRSAVVYRKVIQ
jgi:hypothetical protein